MYLSLSLVRWAERECARPQSVALGLEADCDYEIPGTDISKVVGVGAGSSPVRSRWWRRRQLPFGRRHVVVGKRQKSLSERRWMASLPLYREYARAEKLDDIWRFGIFRF